jgi:integrase
MSLKLIQRPGRPCWYIHGTVRGISVRETTGTADRRAAEEIRIKRENEILQRSIHGAQATATFGEAALSYLELGGSKDFLPPIVERIERTPLAKIDQDFIDKLALTMHPNAKPATRARAVYTPISAVLHHAASRKLCPKPSISRPKPSPGRVRWLKPEEAERLIDACGATPKSEHLRPLVIFLFATGARLSEALYLDWRDVDLNRGHVNLVGADDGSGEIGTKNGEARGVPLHPRMIAELRKLGPRESGAVFLTNDGKPYEPKKQNRRSGGQIKTAFDTACRRAGIKNFTPHCCRHTWATWHYQANHDLQQLMRDGGWKTLAMVLRYAHANSEHAARSVAAALSHWDAPSKPALRVVS